MIYWFGGGFNWVWCGCCWVMVCLWLLLCVWCVVVSVVVDLLCGFGYKWCVV